MATNAKCPGCGAVISGPRDTDSTMIGSAGGHYVYALICKRCSIVLGTVPAKQ